METSLYSDIMYDNMNLLSTHHSTVLSRQPGGHNPHLTTQSLLCYRFISCYQCSLNKTQFNSPYSLYLIYETNIYDSSDISICIYF